MSHLTSSSRRAIFLASSFDLAKKKHSAQYAEHVTGHWIVAVAMASPPPKRPRLEEVTSLALPTLPPEMWTGALEYLEYDDVARTARVKARFLGATCMEVEAMVTFLL